MNEPKLLNKEEVDQFCFDVCVKKGRAVATKKGWVKGYAEPINVAWQDTTSKEIIVGVFDIPLDEYGIEK